MGAAVCRVRAITFHMLIHFSKLISFPSVIFWDICETMNNRMKGRVCPSLCMQVFLVLNETPATLTVVLSRRS